MAPAASEFVHNEAAEFKRKYPGKPYQDRKNTRFAEILKEGRIGVVKASYFEHCLRNNIPFADRDNIPDEYFIRGESLMEQWEKFGARFLVMLSQMSIILVAYKNSLSLFTCHLYITSTAEMP